jgi:hypothetical protein
MLYEITYKNTATSRKLHARISLGVVQDGDEVIISIRELGAMAGPWSQVR